MQIQNAAVIIYASYPHYMILGLAYSFLSKSNIIKSTV